MLAVGYTVTRKGMCGTKTKEKRDIGKEKRKYVDMHKHEPP